MMGSELGWKIGIKRSTTHQRLRAANVLGILMAIILMPIVLSLDQAAESGGGDEVVLGLHQSDQSGLPGVAIDLRAMGLVPAY